MEGREVCEGWGGVWRRRGYVGDVEGGEEGDKVNKVQHSTHTHTHTHTPAW